MMAISRNASMERKTNETDIQASLNIDGSAISKISSSIGFLDHMLDQLAFHGNMDITLKAKGDLHIDMHHTVEDIGIILGKLLKKAMGDRKGIKRYATFYIPMDECLSRVSVDVSGRPFLVWNVNFSKDKIGEFDTELIEEWFRAFAFNAGLTLHVECLYGKNNHHICESLFKALARALKEALSLDPALINKIPSSKGMLDV